MDPRTSGADPWSGWHTERRMRPIPSGQASVSAQQAPPRPMSARSAKSAPSWDPAWQPVAVPGLVRRSPNGSAADTTDVDPLPAAGTAPALTPEEMWTQLVQSKRGFESSPSGPGDTYRAVPATVPVGSLATDDAGNPIGKGVPLGKGYETFAAVQVVDGDGNGVALAAGQYLHGGADQHAEARCVRGLELHGPAELVGGKLVVVSDQSICATCRQRLLDYARSRGLTVIEPFEPVRPKLLGVGEVSPKTASRSSTQAGRPKLTVVARDRILVSPIMEVDGATDSPAPVGVRRAGVVGRSLRGGEPIPTGRTGVQTPR